MNTTNQQPNSPGTFLSIDEWQDDEPITNSWFDNPLMGALGVIGIVACSYCSSAGSSYLDASRQKQDAEAMARNYEALDRTPVLEIDNLDVALTELERHFSPPAMAYLANKANFDPGKKRVVKDKILKAMATKSYIPHTNLRMFSIWFDSEDSRRISALIKSAPDHEVWDLVRVMSNLPNPVPAIISELLEHPTTGQAHLALIQQLQNHDVSTDEVLRRLANKLRSTDNPREFERIVLVINKIAWESGDAEVKKQIVDAMALAGRNLTPEQIEKMDRNVAKAITTYSQFPEMADLLKKLSATNHGNRRFPGSFGTRNTPKADEAAVKLARENRTDPRELLSYEDSELVQEFLWEGKLKGKSEFLNLNMHSTATSMAGFSKAGVSLINSDPNSAIDSLLPVVQRHSNAITRERLSDQFLQKLDYLLANTLKDDLRLPSNSANTNKRKPPEQRKMPASLDLAELLGGKRAAMAIAQAGKKKPEVLKEFKGMLGALIALNEPETYGMIVNAWVIHGKADGLKNVGEAIEPRFIDRLQFRLKKLNAADKQQRRTIHFLIGALNQIGTSKSFPILEELQQSKVVGFRKASDQTIKVIRERSVQK